MKGMILTALALAAVPAVAQAQPVATDSSDRAFGGLELECEPHVVALSDRRLGPRRHGVAGGGAERPTD